MLNIWILKSNFLKTFIVYRLMSGTAETEMQIQIVTHGEAFCPSTMTKETPFANRKLLLEELTNIEKNEMEEAQMEENQIKEGHDDVEGKQDNKAKETPIANLKVLLDGEIEMEEEQMKEILIKEGHEDVGEKQGKKIKACFQRLLQHYAQQKRVIHIDRYERDRSLFVSYWALPTPNTLLSPLGLSSRLSKFMVTRYDYSGRKQAFEEMKIRRLEIENFWKHALGKDMDIMKILKSGSLRFLKQQIQNLDKLIRCKVCLDSDACMVCFPCRHMATCEYCGSFLDQCPVCRTFIEKTEKVNKK